MTQDYINFKLNEFPNVYDLFSKELTLNDNLFKTIINGWSNYTSEQCPLNVNNANNYLRFWLNHNGDKKLSVWLKRELNSLLLNENSEITPTDLITINNIIAFDFLNCFTANIVRLNNALKSTYNPVENYSSIETTVYNSLTDTTEYGHRLQHSFTNLKDKTTSKTGENTTVTNNGINLAKGTAFNKPQQTLLENENDTNTSQRTYRNADDNKTIIENEKTGTETNADSGTDKNIKTGSFEITKHGNIGVTTAEQMLTQHLVLWGNPTTNIMQIIINLLNSQLTLKIY